MGSMKALTLLAAACVLAATSATPTDPPPPTTTLLEPTDTPTDTDTDTPTPGSPSNTTKEKGTNRILNYGVVAAIEGSSFGVYDDNFHAPGRPFPPPPPYLPAQGHILPAQGHIFPGPGAPGHILPAPGIPGHILPAQRPQGHILPAQRPQGHILPAQGHILPAPGHNFPAPGHTLPVQGHSLPGHSPYPSHNGILPKKGSCKYYCPGRWHNQVYCCDDSPSYAGLKCPPVRDSCPGTHYFRNARFCSEDRGCNYSELCCPDVCVNRHVCKEPDRR